MAKSEAGRLLCVLGPNNIGKSAVVAGVCSRMELEQVSFTKLKYPIYDLGPTGPRINTYLRKGNPEGLSAEQAQEIYAQNRRDFEPTLVELLSKGSVIAEDYKYTGIAWGRVFGVDEVRLFEMNSDLRDPEKCVLLDGDRLGGIEENHRHEGRADLWQLCREVYLDLARRFDWPVVRVVNGELEREIDEVYAHFCV